MAIGKPKTSLPAKPLRTAPSEHNLSDHLDYVQAIGMVSIETVDLELRLATLFARVIGVSTRVGQAIFLSPKAEQARLDVFRNAANAALATAPKADPNHVLIKQKRSALIKIERLLHRSGDVIQKRHRIIHDDWNISDKEKSVTRRRVDGTPIKEITPVPISELTLLIKTIRMLIDDVYDLSVEFKDHNPSMVSLAIKRPRTTALKKSSTKSG